MVTCLYNKFFFEKIYKALIDSQAESIIDASGTVWFYDDIELIMVINYGYRKAANGFLI